jgi:hypothetical protein
MARTRTRGITIAANGLRFINKESQGVRIGLRVGAINKEQAEHRLQVEMTCPWRNTILPKCSLEVQSCNCAHGQ